MDKTIPQIANEIGVSRQAVWYKIKNKKYADEIKKHSHKVGKKFFIDEEGTQILKNAFMQDEFNVRENDTNIENKLKQNIKVKEKNDGQIFDILKEQLTAMNKHNEELTKELNQLSKELSKEREHSRILADKLAELAANAQKLHAGDIVVPRLENSEESKTKRKNIFGLLFRHKK